MNKAKIVKDEFSDSEALVEDDFWKIIHLYHKEFTLSHMQVKSYNRFIRDINYIVANYGKFILAIPPQFKVSDRNQFTSYEEEF